MIFKHYFFEHIKVLETMQQYLKHYDEMSSDINFKFNGYFIASFGRLRSHLWCIDHVT